jgi:hypothetical protein
MGIFLIFGSASATSSAKTAEIVRALENKNFTVELSASPTVLKHQAKEYTHVLLVTDASMPPMADMWGAFFKNSKAHRSAALVQTIVPPQFKQVFKFEAEWKVDSPSALDDILNWAFANAKVKEKVDSLPESSKPELPTSTGYESVTGILNFNEPKLESSVVKSESHDATALFIDESDSADSSQMFSIESNETPAISLDDAIDSPFDKIADEPSALKFGQPVSEILNIGELALDEVKSSDHGSDSVLRSKDLSSQPTSISKKTAEPSLSMASASEIKDLTHEPVMNSLDEISDHDLGDSQASQVVKRYALLKEKENREKQKTIDVIRSELEKAKASIQKVQSDKRKLMLKVDEIEADRRALEETVDELRHKVSLSEGDTSQKVKDYQARLENSQFQAKRLEKKLEDFKLRVRLDIQKIRARERELENRLELQKRDTEALISGKDTRLLNQKREIDRMQFEMEILKERLVEETERAEDRNEKLHRALQSLKMAQGMLSGIDEEVISISDRQSDDGSGGEAA